MDNYLVWLNDQLTDAQIRAFASQCGIEDWRDGVIASLQKRLARSSIGKRIFTQIEVKSGQEACVQK